MKEVETGNKMGFCVLTNLAVFWVDGIAGGALGLLFNIMFGLGEVKINDVERDIAISFVLILKLEEK